MELQDYKDFFQKCTQHISDRTASYGSPEVNFKHIANAWSIVLKRKITPYEVSIMMVHLKLARLVNDIHIDSIQDAAAYLAIAQSFAKQEAGIEEHWLAKVQL